MGRIAKLYGLGLIPLSLSACQALPPTEPAWSPTARAGLVFAQANCQGCHSVERNGRSSNSNAPTFPVIANQDGLTSETLSVWLRGAHNYPGEMDFALGADDVDKLVAYMLTLRDPNFRRPPD